MRTSCVLSAKKKKLQQLKRCECIYTDLTHSGLLLTQSHNDDAVSLADAALGPRCEARVRLIEDNAMDVFLLPKPAGQTILMDTLKIGYKYEPVCNIQPVTVCI